VTFEDELGARYEVLEHVGAGGQATVLHARDRQHDRSVALKVYEIEPGASKEDLLGEADVLLRLGPHPGFPIVRDDFFLADRYVIVMDWVGGRDLQHVLAEEGDPGLPFSHVTGWIDQVASALDHLH
jgi:serine/threonine protein kinase